MRRNHLLTEDLVDRAVHALGLSSVRVKIEPAEGADLLLTLQHDDATLRYAVEAKSTPTASAFGPALARLRAYAKANGLVPLLVVEHVAPPAAERLRAAGQQFVDAAGNAYLEGPSLLVHVVGRKPAAPRQAASADPTFTASGVKVTLALLNEPALAEAPTRMIAAAAGVALGSVPPVLRALASRGRLHVAGRRRRFSPNRALLDEWALAYARRLRPKLLLRRMTSPRIEAWTQWRLAEHALQWGAEPAAHLLVGYLTPGVLTLYAERLAPRFIVEHALVAAPPQAADQRIVEVRRRFWGQPLVMPSDLPIVPPVLVYADLLATGDARCIETAELVFENHLAGSFPQG